MNGGLCVYSLIFFVPLIGFLAAVEEEGEKKRINLQSRLNAPSPVLPRSPS